MTSKTIFGLLNSLKDVYTNKPIIKYHNKKGDWSNIYIEEFYAKVYKIAMGLDSLGLRKDDKVCLMAKTSYEWTIIDYAIEIMGLINVPIYSTLTSEQIKYIVKNSETKLFITENIEFLNKIYNNKNELPIVKNYVLINKNKDDNYEEVLSLEELSNRGEKNLKDKGMNYINNIGNSISENDLASILYTSGTTGIPKGVMLSHGNFTANAYGAVERLELLKYDNTLVFLPLSHSFARTCTYALMLGGVTLWYAESFDTLGRDMIEAKPEVMIVVPRVFEKIYERILNSINKEGGLKKIIFYWAKKIAVKVAKRIDNKLPVPRFLGIKHKIADKLVYKKIRAKTGGRVVYTVSGSSSLAKHISYFFFGIKIPILEGYGLTEASPIVSSNSLKNNKIGTVGTAFLNVKVKLAEDKELLVKGPNVMLGYYKDKPASKEAVTQSGWLKTGDICEIDAENFIKIIDRKKDLFKTSGGKFIIPQKIENLARTNPLIAEFVVIAENKKFVSAIVLPDFIKLKKFAKKNKIVYSDNKELIKNEKIFEKYQQIIDEEINIYLARYETIKKFILIYKPFTIENNELTPSLKIRRKAVNQHYAELISKIYQE